MYSLEQNERGTARTESTKWMISATMFKNGQRDENYSETKVSVTGEAPDKKEAEATGRPWASDNSEIAGGICDI